MKLLTHKPNHRTISASQIKLWNSCQKAWGYRYLEKKRAPQTDSQRLGTRVHTILEDWLVCTKIPNKNEVFDTDRGLKYPGRIATAGLGLLPAPGSVETEKEFYLEVEPGLVFHGFVDFMNSGIVGDHKTTTDMKWAMTETQLAQDVQQIIYGKYFFALNKKAVEALVSWVYYKTTGREQAKAVTIKITRKENEKMFQKILPTAREILQAKNIEDLEINTRHCSIYGGCPHTEYCKVDARERLISSMGILEDFMQQQKKQSPISAPEEGPLPVPPLKSSKIPAAPPAVPEVLEAPPMPPTPEVPPVDPEQDLESMSRDQLKALAVRRGLVDQSCRYGADRFRELLQNGAPPPPVPETLCTGSPTVTSEKIKTTAPSCTVPVVADTSKIRTLYVDCAPLVGNAHYLHLSKLIAEALGHLGYDEDYRLYPDNSYGRSAGALSDAVAEILAGYPEPIDLVCYTRVTEHRDCLAMLEGRAELVIRGL